MISTNLIFVRFKEGEVENINSVTNGIYPSYHFKFHSLSLESPTDLPAIFEFLVENSPRIIFINLAEFEITKEFNRFLRLLKVHRNTRHVPIIIQFEDKESLEELRGAFHFGGVYSYIRSDKLDMLEVFVDACYITFDEGARLPRFALAQKLNLASTLQVPAKISYVRESSLGFETDLIMNEGQDFNADIKLFDQFTVHQFKVKQENVEIPQMNYLNQYEADIPFPGPWDDIEPDSLIKDTYLTWVDHNKDDFQQMDLRICLFDASLNTFTSNFYELDKNALVYLRSDLGIDHDYLEILRPEIIIFNVEETPEELHESKKFYYNSLEMLDQIFSSLALIRNYNPIVIVFNTPSNSEAFRKVYRYESLIVFPSEFEMGVLVKLIEQYRKKNPFHEKELKYYLASDYTPSYFHINLPVTITSLTEHEITFLSKVELPYFTVLKFTIPCEGYLTLVPEIRDLPQVADHYHYMGFIHGVTERNRMELRQLVNYIVTASKEDLKELELARVRDLWEKKNKKELERIRDKKLLPADNKKEGGESSEDESTVKKEPAKVEVGKKRNIKGRSKL